MEINADFTRRAAVHAASLPWVPSPMAGVERRMLDRIGGEVARATSIVRYAPDSSFSPHTHGGGEEFFVLEGVFQDEHGDYPPGSYVRNPPGSRHRPGSAAGCTILVKLHQFDPDDRTHVRTETAGSTFEPATGRPGVGLVPLFEDAAERVRLERWPPGLPVACDLEGGIELLVLEGSFTEGGECFERYSWLRLPPGAPLRAEAGADGCRLWVKEGHLRNVRGMRTAASAS
ncbi:cupin domain-containing protein [Geminicoccaceae bacterium 1502E]|nr:cupin domain-containing protein [Geminicoccaceae bacterium 1502E]